MAVPVARVHLKVAHAALPALLPTPPKCNMLPLLQTPPPPCVAAILPKPGRADADERWDVHKTKPAATESSSSSSSPRSGDGFKNTAGRGSCRKNATSPPPKDGRADSVERWDAHKKTARPASSSSTSSGTRTSSSLASSSKCPISRASSSSSAERWDVHKKHRPPQAELLDDGESSSTGSNDDMTDTEEEEILWKPRSMYAGPGFTAAAPESNMLPMPTAFLVPVA